LKKEIGSAKVILGGISFVRYPLSKTVMASSTDAALIRGPYTYERDQDFGLMKQLGDKRWGIELGDDGEFLRQPTCYCFLFLGIEESNNLPRHTFRYNQPEAFKMMERCALHSVTQKIRETPPFQSAMHGSQHLKGKGLKLATFSRLKDPGQGVCDPHFLPGGLLVEVVNNSQKM